MGGLRRRFVQSAVVPIVAVSTIFLFEKAGLAGEEKRITGAAVAQLAASGKDLDLDGFVVEGDVDLLPVRSVGRPFRCRECRFTGALRARDVVFERSVDLSKAVVERELDMAGALFKDPVSLAAINLMGPSSFHSAVFIQRVSFADAEFVGPAEFDHAMLSAGASFVGGERSSFRGGASFRFAEWGGESDFGKRNFYGPVNFQEAVFGGRVSFTLAVFNDEAHFDGCALRAGGAFRAVQFSAMASFQWCRAAGPVDFEAAEFYGEANFHGLTTPSLLSLSGVRLVKEGELILDEISLGDLTMDVRLVDGVRGPDVQETLLAKMESSSQRRGDLIAANEARYRLLSLRSTSTRGVGRFFDRVLYRGLGGYLVRPLHPLASFAVVLLIGGVVRAGASFWSAPVGWLALRTGPGAVPLKLRTASRQLILGAQKIALAILQAFAGAFGSAFRRKPEISLDDSERIWSYVVAGLRWLEYLGYKLLLAVFVLTLGNSNTTIRQLFDAIRG